MFDENRLDDLRGLRANTRELQRLIRHIFIYGVPVRDASAKIAKFLRTQTSLSDRVAVLLCGPFEGPEDYLLKTDEELNFHSILLELLENVEAQERELRLREPLPPAVAPGAGPRPQCGRSDVVHADDDSRSESAFSRRVVVAKREEHCQKTVVDPPPDLSDCASAIFVSESEHGANQHPNGRQAGLPRASVVSLSSSRIARAPGRSSTTRRSFGARPPIISASASPPRLRSSRHPHPRARHDQTASTVVRSIVRDVLSNAGPVPFGTRKNVPPKGRSVGAPPSVLPGVDVPRETKNMRKSEEVGEDPLLCHILTQTLSRLHSRYRRPTYRAESRLVLKLIEYLDLVGLCCPNLEGHCALSYAEWVAEDLFQRATVVAGGINMKGIAATQGYLIDPFEWVDVRDVLHAALYGLTINMSSRTWEGNSLTRCRDSV